MKSAKKAYQAPKFNSAVPPVPVGSLIGFLRPTHEYERNRVFRVLGCEVPPPDADGFTSRVKEIKLEAVDNSEIFYQDAFIFFADRWKKGRVALCTPEGQVIKILNKPKKNRKTLLDCLCDNYDG